MNPSHIEVLRRPIEFTLDPVVGVNYRSLLGPTLRDGHVEGVHHELGVLDRVDGPANDSPTARVHHAAAEDLALSRPVLGDVREPELVESAAGELALGEVFARGNALDALDLRRARKPGDSGIVHEDPDQVDADLDAACLGQLGVHTPRSVGAARGDVDLSNESRQPLAAHHGRRHRSATVVVVALGGDAEDSTALLDGEPGVDEGVDHRVDPFGRLRSDPRSSFARLRISTSASSSRMRFLARRSSFDSVVVRPGMSPRSILSCLIQ